MAVTTTYTEISGLIVPYSIVPSLEDRLTKYISTKDIPEPYEDLMIMYFIFPMNNHLYEENVKAQKIKKSKVNKAIFLEVTIAEEECKNNIDRIVDFLFERTLLRANEEKAKLGKLGISW